MEPGCIPFCKLPNASRLFCDYSSSFDRVRAFYAADPHSFPQLDDQPVKNSYPAERRAAVCEILAGQNRAWGATRETLQNIERLKNGASAIVTGQQVVLFGGPAYSFYKALTAIKLAAALTASGKECVPIFWMATEDHDFAEVSRATLRSREGKLRSFAIESTAPEGSQVGNINLGRQMDSLLPAVQEFLGGSEAASLLAECYISGNTLSTAMAKLFTALFGHYGLVLLDPADARLHRLAEPLLARAASDSAQLNAALQERDRQLQQAGYHAQVMVKPSSTVLFETVAGIRTPVRRSNGGFVVGEKKIAASQLEEHIHAAPQNFSGNALFRPVLQDFLLPTLAYIGGPAEVAYFAQSEVIYRHLLGRTTPILPRASLTVLDARDQRILNHYGFTPQSLLKPAEQVRQLLAEKALPMALQQRFESTKTSVRGTVAELTGDIAKLDPTLQESAVRAASKISYQLTRLQGRVSRALVRRNEEIARHAEFLSTSLFPHGQLQERQIAGISYVSQLGPQLISRLYDAIEPGEMSHRFIPL